MRSTPIPLSPSLFSLEISFYQLAHTISFWTFCFPFHSNQLCTFTFQSVGEDRPVGSVLFRERLHCQQQWHPIADTAFIIAIFHVVSVCCQTFSAISRLFFPPPETNVHFRNPDKVQSYKKGGRCVGHFKCRQSYFTLYIWFHFQNPAFPKKRGLPLFFYYICSAYWLSCLNVFSHNFYFVCFSSHLFYYILYLLTVHNSSLVSIFQLWTCRSAKTCRTGMKSLLFPILYTPTLLSVVPRAPAWRSMSSPVLVRLRFALALTLGVSSQLVVGSQAPAAAWSAPTATS